MSVAVGQAGNGSTIAAALRGAGLRLRAAGIGDAGVDARRLVEHAHGLDALSLSLRAGDRVDADAAARLAGFIERRLAGEPVSRIVGSRAFYGRSFSISPATLDPRPETETLIDAALDAMADIARPRILDIGTGTGCIALTLLAERADASAVGTDISAAALVVADDNARRHGLAGRVTLQRCDFAAGIAGPFNVVVSNPPYIPTATIADLQPEVRCHDPKLALDGGDDGLAPYPLIAAAAGRLLADGWLILEVGHDQAKSVSGILNDVLASRVVRIDVRRDLGGHERCVAARIRHSP